MMQHNSTLKSLNRRCSRLILTNSTPTCMTQAWMCPPRVSDSTQLQCESHFCFIFTTYHTNTSRSLTVFSPPNCLCLYTDIHIILKHNRLCTHFRTESISNYKFFFKVTSILPEFSFWIFLHSESFTAFSSEGFVESCCRFLLFFPSCLQFHQLLQLMWVEGTAAGTNSSYPGR